MLITDTEEYNLIWEKVYDRLKFKPSSEYRGHSLTSALPFSPITDFAVYTIDKMTDEQIEAMQEQIIAVFAKMSSKGRRMYALDWNHSAFLFDPGNLDEQKSIRVEDSAFPGAGYDAYFPSFYPDGDYCFFIDEFFEFGYLGHPWRREVWVFGDEMIKSFDEIYDKLGWEKLR